MTNLPSNEKKINVKSKIEDSLITMNLKNWMFYDTRAFNRYLKLDDLKI